MYSTSNLYNSLTVGTALRQESPRGILDSDISIPHRVLLKVADRLLPKATPPLGENSKDEVRDQLFLAMKTTGSLFSQTHTTEPLNPPTPRRGLSKSEQVAIAVLVLVILCTMVAGLLRAINF